MSTVLNLGLIGDGIAASRAPRLHDLAGRLLGLAIRYERFDLAAPGAPDFETALFRAGAEGLAGVNVTHPYKARVLRRIARPDPDAARLGAVNTVLFRDGRANTGHNTDFSGFIAAWRHTFGDNPPGRVLLLGAGGVGRAIAAGLIRLGAREVRIVDLRPGAAALLCRALDDGSGILRALPGLADDPDGIDGLVNATPIGMHDRPGLPLPADSPIRPAWVFDAVYTPHDTGFLAWAADRGARCLSGQELFFYQGLHAVRHFTGRGIEEDALRRALLEEGILLPETR